ncbi:MAG: hypothetical protein ACRESV_02345 [Nevskiales bacterium]
MFERKQAVLNAAGVGYLLCGFLLGLAAGSAYFVATRDPYRLVRDWDQLLLQRGQYIGVGLLGGLLLFGVVLAALLVVAAVASRASRLHPTSAKLGGALLAAGLAALAVLAVRTAIVTTYAALQYGSTSDEVHKHALLMEAYLGEHAFLLGIWCFFAFAAPGLYLLGRSLRGERGWLADALKLSAALVVLHLPLTLYLMRQSLLFDRYSRALAALDQVLVLGGLALAAFVCARWLHLLGRKLPQ